MRSLAAMLAPVALAFALVGCPRPVTGEDAGIDRDSGYDPVAGNGFQGTLILDDARVRAVDPAILRAGPSPCREPVLVRVYRIVDGDTVWVRGDTAIIDVSVRLIGIDTPEIAHPGSPEQCYGPEATVFTTQLLDRLVWLTFDNGCFDGFDRLLAYLHVGAGEGDLFQRQLLRRGFATVLTVGANRALAPTFVADGEFAAMSGAGLWTACF